MSTPYTIHPTTNPDAVDVSQNGIATTIHRENADPEHRYLSHRLAAAWFGNLPQPEPREIFAAVVEWGENYGEMSPALILAQSSAERAALVRAEVDEFMTMLDDDKFSEVCAALAAEKDADMLPLREWWGILQDHDFPAFLTTYERTV